MLNVFMYPLDVECKNKNNIITEESYAVNTDDNDYRVIIPMSGPFFEKDFNLKHVKSGHGLIRGTDYELTEPYLDIQAVGAGLLYAGVIINNKELRGAFELTYHTIGGQYVLPHTAVVDYLVSHLNDPVGIHWLNIVDRLTQYAPVEHTYDWHDHQNTNFIADAIKDLANAKEISSGNMDDVFTELTGRLQALQDEVDGSHFDEHIANKENPHNLTPALTHSLGVNANAVNTLKAYGKTLLELSTYMVENGVNAEVLNRYLKRDGSNILLNHLRMVENAIIRNSNNTVTLKLKDGAEITANIQSMLRSNSEATENGVTEITCGPNSLKVSSEGDAQDPNMLTLNDEVILTTDNCNDYFTKPTQDEVIDIKVKSSESVTLTGNGTTNNPIEATTTIVPATDTVPGITTISTELSDREDCAASSRLTYELGQMMLGKVPKTRTINGHSLEDDVVLDKEDLGLENVDNTSPADKPLSNAQKAALSKLSDINHTHNWGQISGMPETTVSDMGIAKLVNNRTSSNETKGALLTPFALKELSDETNDVHLSALNLLPIRLDIDQFGGNSYLPLPVQGAYGSAGLPKNMREQTFAGTIEDDGKAVFLRMGEDMVESGVYYFYCDRGEDGSLLNQISTSTQYEPLYLKGTGRRVRSVIVGGDNIMVIGLDNGDKHAVLQNGTMDGIRHRGAKIIPPDPSFLVDDKSQIFIDGDYVYILNSRYSDTEWYLELARATVADVSDGGNAQFNWVRLSGKGIQNRQRTNVTRFHFNDSGIVQPADANKAPLCVRRDNGFWIGAEIQHAWGGIDYCVNPLIGQRDGKIRVLYVISSYAYNTFTQDWRNYRYSIRIDLKTGLVEHDCIHNWPLEYTRNGLNVRDMGYGGADVEGIPGSWGNTKGRAFYSRGVGFNVTYYGSLGIPNLFSFLNHNGVDSYDNCHYKNRIITTPRSVQFIGTYGSPVRNNPRGLHAIPGGKLIGRQNDGGRWISKYDTKGYGSAFPGLGPTLDRVAISSTEAHKYKRIPGWFDGSNYINSGFVIDWSMENQPTRFDGNALTGSLTVASASYNSMNENMKNYVDNYVPRSKWVDFKVTYYKFGDGKCFAYCMLMYYNTAARDSRNQEAFVFEVTYSTSGNAVTHVNVQKFLYRHNHRNNGTGLGNPAPEVNNGSFAYRTTDGHTVYVMQSNGAISYVGNTGYPCGMVCYQGNNYAGNKVYDVYEYEATGWIFIKEFGTMCRVYKDATAEYVAGNLVARTKAGWDSLASTGTKAIISTRVPSGWVIYFTTEILLVMHNKAVKLPKVNIDLSERFPTTHANNKFYVYVTMDANDVPSYVVKERLEDDTKDQLFIGTVTTGATQITNIDIFRAMRFGEFREIDTHKEDGSAHGLGDYTAEQMGVGDVVNGILINSLSEIPEGADRKNYLLSASLIDKLTLPAPDEFVVTKGTIHNGQTLPIPAGYTKEECNFFVSYNNCPDTMSGYMGGDCTYDPNTLVVSVNILHRATIIPDFEDSFESYRVCDWWCVVRKK